MAPESSSRLVLGEGSCKKPTAAPATPPAVAPRKVARVSSRKPHSFSGDERVYCNVQIATPSPAPSAKPDEIAAGTPRGMRGWSRK